MAAFDNEPVPDAPEGPGHRLRLGREQRGLTVAEVADALHLNRSMVEALEADDYDNLPPATFTKGYLRAYARYLELNEDVLLASYERFGQGDASRPLTAAVGGDAPAQGSARRGRWWLAGLVVLGLAGGVLGAIQRDWHELDWQLPGWVSDIRSQGLDAVMPADDSGADMSEPSSAAEDQRQGEAKPDGGSAPDDSETQAPDEARSGSAAADGEAASKQTARDAGSQADAKPDDGGSGNEALADSGGEGASVTASSTGGQQPSDGGSDATTADQRPAERLRDPSGRRVTDPGRVLDEDPLQGAEALLQGDRIADAPIDGEVDQFGGPLGEGPPEPGRDAARVASGSSGDEAPDNEAAGTTASIGGTDAASASDQSATDSSGSSDSTSETASASEAASPQAAAPAPQAEDLARLRFTFSGQSWMEVRDARDRRLLFELVTQPGQRQVVGVPPFRIVIGDVEQVDVSYKGEPVDLSDYSRQGMARLELGGS